MNLYKKVIFLLVGYIITLDAIENRYKNPTNLILQMEESVQATDKNLFKQLLSTYINLFGEIYEKKTGNETTYYISSQNSPAELLTPAEHEKLLNLLDSAVEHQNWNEEITLDLPVFNLQTSAIYNKSFTLDDIIKAIKQTIVAPTTKYSIGAIAGGTIGIISLFALCRFLQQNPQFIQQGTNIVNNQWEDLQDTINKISKYMTDPQNYKQFEKKHTLEIEGMTEKERRDRFREWQKGERIQENINKKIKDVRRFEQQQNLSSENMLDEDRIEIFENWKKEKKQAEKLQEKMAPVEQFEKQHDLDSENMSENERLKRFKEWQKGQQIQQNINDKMKEVRQFEKKLNLSSENMLDEDRIKIFETWQEEQEHEKLMHGLNKWKKKHYWRTTKTVKIYKDMSDEDRIKRYKIYNWQLRFNTPQMSEIEKFEEKENLPIRNYSHREEQPLSEEELIKEYIRCADPLERYLLENDYVN